MCYRTAWVSIFLKYRTYFTSAKEGGKRKWFLAFDIEGGRIDYSDMHIEGTNTYGRYINYKGMTSEYIYI